MIYSVVQTTWTELQLWKPFIVELNWQEKRKKRNNKKNELLENTIFVKKRKSEWQSGNLLYNNVLEMYIILNLSRQHVNVEEVWNKCPAC